MMIDTAHNRSQEKQYEAHISFCLAQMLLPFLDPAKSTDLQSLALERIDDYTRIRQTWLPSRDEKDKNLADDFRAAWKQLTNIDLDDEAAVAEWAEKVENTLRAQSQEGSDADDATHVSQLIRQRASAVRAKRRQQRGLL